MISKRKVRNLAENTMFGAKVKQAIDSGALTEENEREWAIAYNDGMVAENLIEEVKALLRYFR